MDQDELFLGGLHQFASWGVFSTDADLLITGWNQWLEIHSGRLAGDVVGRDLLEIFPELAQRRLVRFYRLTLSGQVVLLSQRLHHYLLSMPSAEPGSRFAEMRQSVQIVPLIKDDAIVGTLTLIEDVTERVAYEEELGARAAQQTALAVLGQLALEGGDIAILLNRAVRLAAATLKVDSGEILEILPDGQNVHSTSFWRNGPDSCETQGVATASLANFVFQASQPVFIDALSQENRFDSARLQALGVVNGVAVRFADGGGPVGIIAVYATQTRSFSDDQVQFLQAVANLLGMAFARRNLENALRSRADELAVADRRKDEFLAMLGHELRNPLAPIRNATHILRLKGSPDPDVEWARDVIDRQVHHMARLIDDLLDVSRITQGKVNLDKRLVALNAIIERAVETSRPLVDERKHKLSISLPQEPLWLEADAARLIQVVGNLLNNAAKYTPERGQILLTATREESEMVLRVRDTGVGIPATLLPTVFDLFTQLDRSADRSEGGLGIGLTLVRSLVALHGGKVEAFSDGPGRGSEFVVRLPVLADQATRPERRSAKRTPADPGAAGQRILVVDDNQDSSESLAKLLRLYGHRVETCVDGPTALAISQQFRPEVVLLDIGLPGMDGLEIAWRLRHDLGLHDAFIIAMTGYGQEDDKRRSREAGFNEHLVKPIEPEGLQLLLSEFAKSSKVELPT